MQEENNEMLELKIDVMDTTHLYKMDSRSWSGENISFRMTISKGK